MGRYFLFVLVLCCSLGYSQPSEPATKRGSAAGTGPSGSAPESRVALVIGNGKYQYVPRLANPTDDARLIAETLKRAGFTLVGGKAQLDLDKTAFHRTVQQFSTAIQGAGV